MYEGPVSPNRLFSLVKQLWGNDEFRSPAQAVGVGEYSVAKIIAMHLLVIAGMKEGAVPSYGARSAYLILALLAP